MGLTGFATGAALAMLQPQQELPAAQALWTIRNDDCQSVDADGEPWRECGFQAHDMNADGSRVLTLSVSGSVQLWDGGGKQIARIDWQDEAGGASGFPSGELRIVGKLGVAVVHQNQLLIVDLNDGRVVSRLVLPLMLARDLRPTPAGTLLATTYSKDWRLGVIEISLPGGETRPLPQAEVDAKDVPVPWPRGIRVVRSEDAVLLRSGSEKIVARLPLAAGGCAGQWRVGGGCAITPDGRKLLAAAPVPLEGPHDARADVTLYALPDAGD